MSQLDYLAIGHVARDLTPTGDETGGTVAYSGATAWALGCRTAILTSFADDFTPDLTPARVSIERLPASETTTFKNVYLDDGREQFVLARAERLTPSHVPHDWKAASIVHLAPIADELDAALVHSFSNNLIGLTPQGWLRTWDDEGRVRPRLWEAAREVLPLTAAVILSDKDVADATWIEQFRRWTSLLVVTHGAGGCTVFMGGEKRHVPAPQATEVNPTGAGDIFAAAFFVRLFQTKGNPWEAARFANRLAAHSVSAPNFASKIRSVQAVLEM